MDLLFGYDPVQMFIDAMLKSLAGNLENIYFRNGGSNSAAAKSAMEDTLCDAIDENILVADYWERALLAMVRFGFTQQEIANRVGVNQGTVSRAITFLHKKHEKMSVYK